MAKKESTFKNMFFALLVVSLASAISLAYVNHVTEKPRSTAKLKKQNSALSIVLPEFDRLDEPKFIETNDPGEKVMLLQAYKNNKPVGVAVETYSLKGYGGKISLLIGFLNDGSIYNTAVLSHSETPGFGDNMEVSKSDFSIQFNGKNPEHYKLKIKKNGGDVDAISRATISSIAFCDAVERAYNALKNRPETKTKPKSITDVLPPHAELTELTLEVEKGYTIFQATNEQKEIVAYGVESSSEIGFNGKMIVWVGFLPEGTIYDTKVSKHRETSGYGDMIEEEKSDFTKQFKEKNPEIFKLQPKSLGGDVDVFSGATITTEGYCDAVQKAFDLLKRNKLIP